MIAVEGKRYCKKCYQDAQKQKTTPKKCINHPDKLGIVLCKRCSGYLCQECIICKDDKRYCKKCYLDFEMEKVTKSINTIQTAPNRPLPEQVNHTQARTATPAHELQYQAQPYKKTPDTSDSEESTKSVHDNDNLNQASKSTYEKKSNILLKLHFSDKFKIPLEAIIIVLFLFVVVLGAIITDLATTNIDELEDYARNKEWNRIENYFIKHQNSGNQTHTHVNYALQLMLNSNDTKLHTTLVDLVKSNKLNISYLPDFFNYYNKRDLDFMPSEVILDLIKNQGANDYFISSFVNCQDRDFPKNYIKLVKALLGSSNGKALKHILSANRLMIERDIDASNLKKITMLYLALQDSIRKNENLIKNLPEMLSSNQQRIESVKEEISQRKEEIKKYKNNIITGFWLSGLVVGRANILGLPNSYEIALTNGRRALLFTTKTNFQSQGYFSVFVRRTTGELPITLKENYGGFNQIWKVYTEFDNDVDNDSTKIKIAGLKEDLSSLENRLSILRDEQKKLEISKSTIEPNLIRFRHQVGTYLELINKY